MEFNEHGTRACQGQLCVGHDQQTSPGKCSRLCETHSISSQSAFVQHVSVDMTRVESLAQELQSSLTGKGIQWDEEGWHYRFASLVNFNRAEYVVFVGRLTVVAQLQR